MPDFILPDEADHCTYCGAVLRDPPNCCESMRREYHDQFDWEHAEQEFNDLEAYRKSRYMWRGA